MIKQFSFLVMLLVLVACTETEKPKVIPQWDQEKSTEMNKNLAIEEELQIKFFLEQHKDWKMEKSGTGLQYFIYEEGEGLIGSVGQTADVEMKITLLDGSEVYSTKKDHVDEFVIDKSEIESGIHEGIKKMKKGGKAKLIIPSHLAHGLIGDFEKIPPLSILVVDIHLLNLN